MVRGGRVEVDGSRGNGWHLAVVHSGVDDLTESAKCYQKMIPFCMASKI